MPEAETKDDIQETTPDEVSKPEGGSESPDRSEIIQELETKQASIEAEQRELGDDGAKKNQKRVDALKKEEQRIKDNINALRTEKRDIDKTLVEKLREENLESAKLRIAKEFGYDKPEALETLTKVFSKHDSGSVTEQKIYEDLRRAHVQLNAEKYLALEQEHRRLSEGADAYTASMSSSGAAGGSAPESASPDADVPLSKEDYEAARWAGMPIAKYAQLKKEGKI